MARLRAILAACTAFLLPLGTIGMAGVGVAGLTLVVASFRGFRIRPVHLAGLPIACMTVLSTALAPAHTESALLSAIGMAILYTAGLAAAIVVSDAIERRFVASAFVLGSTVLAFSLALDAMFGRQRIPAGLFKSADLHNWAATLFVLAWPLALHELLTSRRAWSIIPVVLLPSAVLLALSWSGTLALAAATLLYLAHPRAPVRGRVRLLAAVLLIATSVGSFAAFEPKLGLLGEVLSDRARVVTEGIELAKLRPLRGWGFSANRLGPAFARETVGSYYMDDVALPHFHDLFAQQVFENGIVGITALGLLISTILVLQRGPMAPATLASAGGFLIAQSFDYSWHFASILLSFLLVTAIGLKRARSSGT